MCLASVELRYPIASSRILRHSNTSVLALKLSNPSGDVVYDQLGREGAATLAAGRERRAAAEALFAMMDDGGFALDQGAIDQLNDPRDAGDV